MTPETGTTELTGPVHLHVTSEVDRLKQVIVHTPGEELSLVSPENRNELLFEDILFSETAHAEHQSMCRVFGKIIGSPTGVLQVSDLLLEAFREEDARMHFAEQVCRAMTHQNYEAYESELKQLDAQELHRFALTGQSSLDLTANPIPNLLFTRDLCAVVGDHVILSHAATPARERESLLIHTILRYHPAFEASREKIIELPRMVTFEGGDLLVASDKIVMIGHSARTSFGAIVAIAEKLLAHTSIEHVLMVNIPKRRAFMHLDTVFTFVDYDEAIVFPPIFLEGWHNVAHFQAHSEPGKFLTAVHPSLLDLLSDLMEKPIKPIMCGGENRLNQQREQWTDGANAFALAPGIIVGYERNKYTFDTLRDHGYHLVSSEGFLSYYADGSFTSDTKIVVKMEGNELSRGRGGARCMTLPVARSPYKMTK